MAVCDAAPLPVLDRFEHADGWRATLRTVMADHADDPDRTDHFPQTLEAAIHGIEASLDRQAHERIRR